MPVFFGFYFCFVISSNLLMFGYILFFFSAKTPIDPGFPLTSLVQSLRATRKAVSQALGLTKATKTFKSLEGKVIL